MADPLFRKHDVVHAPADATIGPTVPDYIPIRVEIPSGITGGVDFQVRLEFDSGSGNPNGTAPVQLTFKDELGNTPNCVANHSPQSHPNLLVSLTSHVGTVLCRINSIPGSQVKAVAKDTDGGNEVSSLFAQFGQNPES